MLGLAISAIPISRDSVHVSRYGVQTTGHIVKAEYKRPGPSYHVVYTYRYEGLRLSGEQDVHIKTPLSDLQSDREVAVLCLPDHPEISRLASYTYPAGWRYVAGAGALAFIAIWAIASIVFFSTTRM